MNRILSLLCVPVLCAELCFSQVLEGEKAAQLIKGASTVRISRLSGNPSFIRFDKSFQLSPADLNVWLTKNISLPQNSEWMLLRTEAGSRGFTHYRYQQFVNGLPVEGAILIAHVLNNRIESINGELFNMNAGNHQPALSEAAALAKALSYFAAELYKWEIPEEEQWLKSITQDTSATFYPKGTLVMAPENMDFKKPFHQAYRFDIYSVEPLKRAHVYVNASSGEITGDMSIINHGDAVGTAVTKYSGAQSIVADNRVSYYRLRETGRGGGIETYDMNQGKNKNNAVDFTDADNYWDNVNPQQDEAATDAHWGAEMTYDYFYHTFGRDGFDGFGYPVISYVHYDSSYGNAFFDGSSLTYGDGGGHASVFTGPLTTLDICGHEFTHGVTQNSAGLYYERESGALNESFSDIFGTVIEFTAKPSAADWVIGRENTIGNTGIRDMSNPKRLNDPDTYQRSNWVPTTSTICDTLNDYCGVHSNSGVQNHWFYLLSQGGSGTNDDGDAYSITGIGMQKAAEIAYNTLTVYLTPTSDYDDARFYSIEAATDLYGGCSNEAIQTTNAWHAVGVGNVFSGYVTADFWVNKVYGCTPGSTNFGFYSSSVNSSIFSWDFGDGNTFSSSSYNTFHTYANATDIYSVQLIASNNICSDTAYKSVFVGGLRPSPCLPVQMYTNSVGIDRVILNTIDHLTDNYTSRYTDYTCSKGTFLTQAIPYPISVNTGSYVRVRVWIDYNYDGDFNPVSELVFSDDGGPTYLHSGFVKPPSNCALNVPLRMRVASSPSSGIAPCDTLYNGEVEDYTIIVLPNLDPSSSLFGAVSNLTCNGTLSFQDSSINLINSWHWDFGDGTTSTQQNPVHHYTASGSYDVTLTVCNNYGCDTLTKENYAKVFSSVPVCDTAHLATNGDTTYISQCFGNLVDLWDTPNRRGRTLITIPGAQSITLYIYHCWGFDQGDPLSIYDGLNGPLLYRERDLFPGDIDTITSSGNSIFIYRWFGNNSYPGYGFGAVWVANGPAAPPVADFSINSFAPPLNTEVQFTDLTSPPFGSWSWNLGDGTYSTKKNPSRVYQSDGAYTISLSIENCYGKDSISKTIQVQNAPSISINVDTISLYSANCDSPLTVPLTIYNSGQGDLAIENIVSKPKSYGVVEDSSVLIITNASPFFHSVVTGQFMQFGVSADIIAVYQIDTTDLLKYDIIYFFEYEGDPYYSSLNYYLPKFEAFLKSGGIIIYAIDRSPYVNLITVYLPDSVVSVPGGEYFNTVLLPNHPIASNLPLSLFVNNGNSSHLKDLPAGASVITETNNGHLPTTAEYDFAKGKVIASGISMVYNGQSFTGQLLENTIAYSLSLINKSTSWLSIDSSRLTIAPGDSAIVNVNLEPQSLVSGNHFTNIYITNNDTQQSLITIPVHFLLEGSPRLALSDTCIDFDNVGIGLPATDSIIISNEGCDTLKVYDVNSMSDEFLVDDTSFAVLPGQDYSLRITHSPTLPGSTSASFEILNNHRDTSICVSGTAFFPPLIAVVDTSLELTLQRCQSLALIPFKISNNGFSALNWVFAVSGTGLSANPRNGSINSEDSVVINLVFSVSGLNNGQYNRQFSIFSNDPSHPEIIISVIMNIVSDSCVPKPAFSFVNQLCDNVVRFTDSTTNNPISRQWQFGDGTSSTVISPTHVYANPALYTVTLTATNNYGSASANEIIDVDYVRVSIAAFDTSYVDEIVQLNSNSKGASSWDWAFGDNQTSHLENPTHVYNDIGNFSITLFAQNNTGCTYSDSFPITIEPPVSVNPASSDKAVKIYPNPTGQIIYIEYERIAENEMIRIYNSIGKIVYENELEHPGVNRQEINVATYPKGTYLVEITGEIGDVRISEKIVID